ncbi:glycosyltransferase family 2 protein [Fulvivirga lutimaris]|nr:glycosyltransferase family 2 protein [Fulvivirga lutimaris]MTI38310.1 glycosyltransferase family 2 protein [Fulvivirga lutimaris]
MNKVQYPLVTLITINYNAEKDTDEFLASCEQLSYPNLELIIVDNASKNIFELRKTDLNVTLIRSEENLGFAGGNNLGIDQANGEFIIFINNDTVVYSNFIQPIIEVFKNHSDAAMVTPKVVFPDEKTIQYAGAKAINPWTGRGKRLGLGEIDNGQYNFTKITELGHGACLAVRKTVIDEVGKMPEEFFLYYEEHDWTEQIKNAGHNIYYTGNSSIIHKESVSIGQDSPLKAYYMMRSRILYLRKNCSGLKKLTSILIIIVLTIPKNTIQYLMKGRFDLIKATFRGIGDHFTLSLK